MHKKDTNQKVTILVEKDSSAQAVERLRDWMLGSPSPCIKISLPHAANGHAQEKTKEEGGQVQ